MTEHPAHRPGRKGRRGRQRRLRRGLLAGVLLPALALPTALAFNASADETAGETTNQAAGESAARTVEPSAIDDAPGVPPNEQVLMIMGQDSSTLGDYRRDVMDNPALNAPEPGGVTLYTNLVISPDGGGDGPGAGLDGPVDYGAGVVDFPSTLAQYPESAVSIGLYLSDTDFAASCGNQPLRAIIGTNDDDVQAGNPSLVDRYRAELDSMIETFRSWDRDVYLRIGYEFDGPWNCYNTDYYKQAYQYIATRIDELNADRVATVWQTAAWPLNTSPENPEWNYIVTDPTHFDKWYPGDEYVDWVGLSTFYQPGSVQTQWGCATTDIDPIQQQERVLDFARSHEKPVMIAEAAPQGYDNGEATSSCIMGPNPAPVDPTAVWQEWYDGYFSLIEENRDVIRAASYINTDWDSQTMWQCPAGSQPGSPQCPNGYWGDSRVQANPQVLENFLNEVRAPHFVNGSAAE
ncbi:endo-1,3-beta-xylanase [Streptomyces sp. 3MP-14]|uniref:Endo-1,3-beta-xylanase n=1 Tax=Streptomyces mimosae TaxID=2586635 RepID=A0A5N6AFL2_9ACTN|nr:MULTISPECIES: endo-1,3-beta-xylanase [Streptomyces]KAB8166962.1 endo-1,3-beta-xylanase [Streptomyces mimosae]KAB8176903.1 endo-1,3-beta-xylanase [Streptomyces sp. 3MP-14]